MTQQLSASPGATTYEALDVPHFDAANWKRSCETDEKLARLFVFYGRKDDQEMEAIARKLQANGDLGALCELMECYDSNAEWHRSAVDAYSAMAARILIVLDRVVNGTKRAA